MKQTKRLRRVGCGFLLAFWFALIVITPCAAITLISGSEIRLTRSDVPDDYALRMWLVQDANRRGLGVSTGFTTNPTSDTVCTITDTHFVLWKGSAQSSRGCACYAKADYTLTSEGADACQIAGV